MAPQLFVLPDHGWGTPRADALAVRRHVQQAYPWARADTADLRSSADAPLKFTLTSRTAHGTIQSDDEVFADPFRAGFSVHGVTEISGKAKST